MWFINHDFELLRTKLGVPAIYLHGERQGQSLRNLRLPRRVSSYRLGGLATKAMTAGDLVLQAKGPASKTVLQTNAHLSGSVQPSHTS